jgi:hypothetical protein
MRQSLPFSLARENSGPRRVMQAKSPGEREAAGTY